MESISKRNVGFCGHSRKDLHPHHLFFVLAFSSDTFPFLLLFLLESNNSFQAAVKTQQ